MSGGINVIVSQKTSKKCIPSLPVMNAVGTEDKHSVNSGEIVADFSSNNPSSNSNQSSPTLLSEGCQSDSSSAKSKKITGAFGRHRHHHHQRREGNHAGLNSSGKMEKSVPFFEPHNVSGEYCHCPCCKVYYYISYLYREQRRASNHVLTSRPSPSNPPELLPPLPELECPTGVEVCPVMATFGFCPYSLGCYLPHPSESSNRRNAPLTPRLNSAEEELERLVRKAAENSDNEFWSCDVCGQTKIDASQVAPIGEMYYYRCCPRCSFPCYAPYITYLLEFILADVGDDYQLFKDEVVRFRKLLPDEFKIPLSYEAHRISTTVFAWSLVSPQEAKYAMEAALKVLPDANCIMSVGSGGGYIEHLFNRVLHEVPLLPKWEVNREKFPHSSFDGVRVKRPEGKLLPIFAFDELALKANYSVHVSLGDPLVMLSATRKTILLLCWPPFGSAQEEQSSMAFEALEYFMQQGGEVVIYIGDVASTGDWRFHQSLAANFTLVKDYTVRRELRRWCPNQMGVVYAGNDTIGVYRIRRPPS